jgi:hypothetical protein
LDRIRTVNQGVYSNCNYSYDKDKLIDNENYDLRFFKSNSNKNININKCDIVRLDNNYNYKMNYNNKNNFQDLHDFSFSDKCFSDIKEGRNNIKEDIFKNNNKNYNNKKEDHIYMKKLNFGENSDYNNSNYNTNSYFIKNNNLISNTNTNNNNSVVLNDLTSFIDFSNVKENEADKKNEDSKSKEELQSEINKLTVDINELMLKLSNEEIVNFNKRKILMKKIENLEKEINKNQIKKK